MLAPRHKRAGHLWFAATMLVLTVIAPEPAWAQHASQPGFDPRQTEKRFDALQSEQAAAAT